VAEAPKSVTTQSPIPCPVRSFYGINSMTFDKLKTGCFASCPVQGTLYPIRGTLYPIRGTLYPIRGTLYPIRGTSLSVIAVAVAQESPFRGYYVRIPPQSECTHSPRPLAPGAVTGYN